MTLLNNALHKLSIGAKVSLIGSIGLALVLMAISLALLQMSTAQGRDRADSWVGAKVSGVVQAIDALEAPSQALVVKVAPQLAKFFLTFEYDEAKAELTAMGSVVDEANGGVYVDTFAQQSGSIGAVFAKKGDRFVSAATSLKAPGGDKRLHAAPLTPTHPAYPAVMAGRAYSGRELIAGKYHMTRYSPAKDASGKVVAVLFVAVDLSNFQQSIEKAVAATKLFETGQVAIVDPKSGWAQAQLVSHPQHAGKLLKDVLPDAQPMFDSLAAAQEPARLASPGLFGLTGNDRQLVVAKSGTAGWWVVGEFSDRESLATQTRTTMTIQALLLAAAGVLGGGLWLLLRVWITRPLRALEQCARAVAGGDLTQACRSDRNDEIGNVTVAMEELRTKLQATLSTVRLSSESVSTASQQIAAGNGNLSSRTEQAAACLQQTAASMSELTTTVRQTADSAAAANQLATSASQAAAKGGEVVSEVVATMDEINTASRRINDIIAVIDGIAFQTNILALNAAVEAARAGEQGRGFAVVASEVRSLAQRSAGAAQEIKRLISASTEKVDNGARLVRNAGSAMTDIVTSVQRVAGIIGEISSATGAQREGMNQINGSVSHLDNMTQQNAALVEESTAAAESLRQQAADLFAVLQGFRLEAAQPRM